MRFGKGGEREAARHHKKALKLLKDGRLPEALVSLERALAADPSRLEPRVNLGSVYYRMAIERAQGPLPGWLDEAAKQYRHVLGIDPDHAEAALGLAAVLNAQGDHAGSLRELERLARARPNHRDVQYNFAIALGHAGRIDEARLALARELEHHPDHAAARELLAKLDSSAG